MTKWSRQLAFTVAAWAAASLSARAQTGAITSGNWETPSIWTGGTVPGLGDLVYIGSTYPSARGRRRR